MRAQLKIFTQNLWGVPNFSPKIRKRFAKFFSLLDEIGADIYALQETFHNKICHQEILIPWQKKSPHFARGCATSLLKLKFFDSGLTTLSHFEILHQEFHPFHKGSSVDRLSNKGVLFTKLKDENGIEIDFFNTHLQADYNHSLKKTQKARRHQIEQLLSWVEKQTSPQNNLCLTGDFNFMEDTEGYKILTDHGFTDIKRELYPNKVTHPLHTIKHKNPKKYRRLDYVFVKSAQDWIWNVEKSSAKIMDLFVSDHRGVFADLVFEKI